MGLNQSISKNNRASCNHWRLLWDFSPKVTFSTFYFSFSYLQITDSCSNLGKILYNRWCNKYADLNVYMIGIAKWVPIFRPIFSEKVTVTLYSEDSTTHVLTLEPWQELNIKHYWTICRKKGLNIMAKYCSGSLIFGLMQERTQQLTWKSKKKGTHW